MILLAGCAKGSPPAIAVAPDSTPQVVRVTDTVKVRDPELEQQVNRLEMQLLGKEAQMEDLQARLDEARRDVVRTMAKLQTVATRAEAASAMAEAELAVNSLKKIPGAQTTPEVTQAASLLQQSTDVFNRQNFGGALYLANQAKDVAGAGKGRLAGGRPDGTERGSAVRRAGLPGDHLAGEPEGRTQHPVHRADHPRQRGRPHRVFLCGRLGPGAG